MRVTALNEIKKTCCDLHKTLEVCGEPEIPCTGCISTRDLDVFGIDYKDLKFPNNYQRSACACLGIKHELLNNKHPCAHKCKYCYWKD